MCRFHPFATCCPACCYWSDNVASPFARQVDDDVAPTSLNEGRGKVLVLVLVVVLHLGLKYQWVDEEP